MASENGGIRLTIPANIDLDNDESMQQIVLRMKQAADLRKKKSESGGTLGEQCREKNSWRGSASPALSRRSSGKDSQSSLQRSRDAIANATVTANIINNSNNNVIGSCPASQRVNNSFGASSPPQTTSSHTSQSQRQIEHRNAIVNATVPTNAIRNNNTILGSRPVSRGGNSFRASSPLQTTSSQTSQSQRQKEHHSKFIQMNKNRCSNVMNKNQSSTDRFDVTSSLLLSGWKMTLSLCVHCKGPMMISPTLSKIVCKTPTRTSGEKATKSNSKLAKQLFSQCVNKSCKGNPLNSVKSNKNTLSTPDSKTCSVDANNKTTSVNHSPVQISTPIRNSSPVTTSTPSRTLSPVKMLTPIRTSPPVKTSTPSRTLSPVKISSLAKKSSTVGNSSPAISSSSRACMKPCNDDSVSDISQDSALMSASKLPKETIPNVDLREQKKVSPQINVKTSITPTSQTMKDYTSPTKKVERTTSTSSLPRTSRGPSPSPRPLPTSRPTPPLVSRTSSRGNDSRQVSLSTGEAVHFYNKSSLNSHNAKSIEYQLKVEKRLRDLDVLHRENEKERTRQKQALSDSIHTSFGPDSSSPPVVVNASVRTKDDGTAVSEISDITFEDEETSAGSDDYDDQQHQEVTKSALEAILEKIDDAKLMLKENAAAAGNKDGGNADDHGDHDDDNNNNNVEISKLIEQLTNAAVALRKLEES